MKLNELSTLITEVYIVLNWGLGNQTAPPSQKLAEQVYERRWVDTKADNSVYYVKEQLAKVAPQLNRREGIQLVLEIHRAMLAHRGIVGGLNRRAEVPQALQKYLS